MDNPLYQHNTRLEPYVVDVIVTGAVVRVSYIHLSDDVYGLQRVLSDGRQVYET